MWDLPEPGLEPVSLALAGRFLTTVPPGKSKNHLFFCNAQEAQGDLGASNTMQGNGYQLLNGI